MRSRAVEESTLGAPAVRGAWGAPRTRLAVPLTPPVVAHLPGNFGFKENVRVLGVRRAGQRWGVFRKPVQGALLARRRRFALSSVTWNPRLYQRPCVEGLGVQFAFLDPKLYASDQGSTDSRVTKGYR